MRIITFVNNFLQWLNKDRD